MRRLILAIMLFGQLTLVGCGMDMSWPDPCSGSFNPTQDDLNAAAKGYEVEDDDTSCELTRDGKWVYDD